jgi:phospholipase/lecithinase/hemolysin
LCHFDFSAGAFTVRVCFIGVLWLSFFAASAGAGPFSNLYVFGDSLSDVGNTNAVTPFLFKYPGRYYYQGRFSNGPVWVESLATSLGLPPITRSTAGGNNFAHGGAQTAGYDEPIISAFVDDIDEQVDDFLPRSIDSDALVVVYAGANDFDNGQTEEEVPVANLRVEIDRLIAAGARQFLIPNLPLLGETPKYRNGALAGAMNGYSEVFNDLLAVELDALQSVNPSLTIHHLDVETLFGRAMSAPSSFGLVNATDPAAPGLEPGDSSYNTNLIVPNPNEYLFWDNLHPTAAVHSILAQQAADLLLYLRGDYNDDGTVNAADYTVWRNTLGDVGSGLTADGNRDGGVDFDDFQLWKSFYGMTGAIGALDGPLNAVPEPMLLAQVCIGFAAVLLRGGRFMGRGRPVSKLGWPQG